MRSEFLTLNGQRFHALCAGDPGQPVILFLHGFPEYCGAWEELLKRLGDRYFCVAPDQRGYGQSWRPAGAEHYGAAALVGDALGVIDHFGGHAAAVVGHDWGAAVAYALAMRASDRLDRLVIVNGAHPGPFQRALAAGGAQSEASQYIDWLRRQGSARVLAADGFAGLMQLFGAKMDLDWLTPDRRRAYVAAWRDEAGLSAMIDWYRASPVVVAPPGQPLPPDALPRFDTERLRIRMPHLLIWGMGDTALLPEAREGLSAYCDDLTVHEVPGADHWITHQEPDLLAELICEFVDGRG